MTAHADLMNRVARTDATFALRGDEWWGKCLICGGPLRFDARTGIGANVEHIVPRALGGTNDLRNLGVTHPHCNSEKGRHWDATRRHRAKPDAYRALIARIQAERLRRWRDDAGTDDGDHQMW
ncbi:MAG TPA: HNH endonuclease [Ktedonobacterales bacterium]